ncbi:hypothetical protein F2P81_023700 [Scophthalmus maximus]|uniref:Reverse transcriptase domain-containing protein n=1 Tax=Scophthalmus maximus TaxID=52904 RepID=A0A6A4RUM4_SCOMX|nr:hypothetical protein F2P81_023700 [Scophthalmus maximus]
MSGGWTFKFSPKFHCSSSQESELPSFQSSYVKEIDITERLSDCGTGVCTTTSDGYITTHNTQDLHRTTWMIFKIVTHSLNQFAYRANRSVDDEVNMASTSPSTLLFVDFSSAFNTVLPALLQDKLFQLHVPDSTCRWITDFLSDRKQRVKLGKHISESQTISTGSRQGCVLSPLLFSLYTSGCTSSPQSVKLLKFADDTTLIGLISGRDESAYRTFLTVTPQSDGQQKPDTYEPCTFQCLQLLSTNIALPETCAK